MEGPFNEKDWKYMRSIHDELLHALCSRINQAAVGIATEKNKNPHEQYLALFRHINDSDDRVADCFNDWRRSNIDVKIMFLRRHGLLQDSHVENFSDSAKEWLAKIAAVQKNLEKG